MAAKCARNRDRHHHDADRYHHDQQQEPVISGAKPLGSQPKCPTDSDWPQDLKNSGTPPRLPPPGERGSGTPTLRTIFQSPPRHAKGVLTSHRLLENNQRLQENISRLEATLAQEKAARQTAAAHGIA